MEELTTVLTDKQIHEKNVKLANKLYILAIILCAAGALGAIVWAVLDNVFLGLLLGVCTVIIYMALSANIMYRYLGISYKSFNGSLCITAFYGKNRREAYIPEKVIMLSVTSIEKEAFDHKSSASIERLHLPSTLLEIGENIFKGCESLKEIYFDGDREQWEKIEKHTDFSSYELFFKQDGEQGADEQSEEISSEVSESAAEQVGEDEE